MSLKITFSLSGGDRNNHVVRGKFVWICLLCEYCKYCRKETMFFLLRPKLYFFKFKTLQSNTKQTFILKKAVSPVRRRLKLWGWTEKKWDWEIDKKKCRQELSENNIEDKKVIYLGEKRERTLKRRKEGISEKKKRKKSGEISASFWCWRLFPPPKS